MLIYSAGLLNRHTTFQDDRRTNSVDDWYAIATSKHSFWWCTDTQWRWSIGPEMHRTNRKYLSRIYRERAWHSTERSNSCERWEMSNCLIWKLIKFQNFPCNSYVVNCNWINRNFAFHHNFHDIHRSYTPVFEIIVCRWHEQRYLKYVKALKMIWNAIKLQANELHNDKVLKTKQTEKPPKNDTKVSIWK